MTTDYRIGLLLSTHAPEIAKLYLTFFISKSSAVMVMVKLLCKKPSGQLSVVRILYYVNARVLTRLTKMYVPSLRDNLTLLES
jgi:hypothetical protein